MNAHVTVAAMPPVYAHVTGELERMTREFITTGITSFIADSFGEDIVLLHPNMVSKYMRQVAKETKRPFLFLRGRSVSAWPEVQLTVPLNKRCEPVAASLLLISTPTDRWRPRSVPGAVSHYTDTKQWRFIFRRAEGLEIARNWLQSMQEDRALAQMLRLPTE